MSLEIILFDMDGTLVCYQESSFHSSWDALGFAAGQKEAWLEKLNYYFPRPHLYKEWASENCKLLQGLPVEPTLAKILPPPTPAGIKEFFHYLNHLPNRPLTGIITSGVDLIAQYLAQEYQIDFFIANEVHTQEGYFTGTGKINVPLWKKGEIVEQVLHQYQIPPEHAAFLGDNENDIPAWEKVGLPLAINLDENKPGSTEKCLASVKQSFQDFFQVLTFLKEYLAQPRPLQ